MRTIKEYFHILVVGGLLASIILNIFLFSKIKNMAEDIFTIMNNQSSIMSSVNSQSGDFQFALDNFMQEQKWISPIQMDIEKLEDGISSIKFEWQIKELPKSADVMFHYKYGDTDKYQSVPVQEIENGLYETIVPIDIEIDPEWYISSIEEDNAGNYEERPDKIDYDKPISYYVTVATADLIKSSEIASENLDYIGASRYGNINVDVFINKEDYHVSVHASKEESEFFINEAYVISYQNENKVHEEKLKLEKQNDDSFQVFSTEENLKFNEKDDTTLELKLIYNNGKTFEKEIYPYK